MKQFEITIYAKVIYNVVVEAETKEEAEVEVHYSFDYLTQDMSAEITEDHAWEVG